jgi:hypothetical protein
MMDRLIGNYGYFDVAKDVTARGATALQLTYIPFAGCFTTTCTVSTYATFEVATISGPIPPEIGAMVSLTKL